MAKSFKALWVTENADKTVTRAVVTRSTDDLPPGEVLVRVEWSALNYKDALSATGNKGVTRKYPHTPGIDAAGVVEESSDPKLQPGTAVIVTSYDLGMNTPGGFGGYIRVPAAWVVPMPKGLDARASMILGTGGLTAGLSLRRLQSGGVKPGDGEVLVTGATGGVGSMAVAILARAGYTVVAGSGKADAADWLRGLGASEVIGRADLDDSSGRPMLKGRWAGVIDTVGGNVLATALKTLRYGGVATCCGLVASPDLPTSVFPFILRGVSLLGVDSAECPMAERAAVWQHLAGDWKPANLDGMAHECTLETLEPEIEAILKGRQRGRVLVRLAG